MAESKEMAILEFELERSCNAAAAANENSRPMAQAGLLINGAAATAVIAFLTKDKIEPIMLSMIPWTLAFYGIGVALGSVTMYFMTESLDYWNCFWELRARGSVQEEIDEQEKKGNNSWWIVRISFFSSIGAFVLGSGVLAIAIWQIPAHSMTIGGPG